MADRARNQRGLGKAVTFNVLTPMTRWGAFVVGVILWILDRFERTQKTAKQLAFLPFVHWVIVKRNRFPRLDDHQPAEKLHYDYLFFLSAFNGPWGPYIEAFADVLYLPLDSVWFWSIGFVSSASALSPERFALEFDRLFISVQNKIGTFGPVR
jgi:hypothetical protein